MKPQKYKFRLTEDERTELMDMLSKSNLSKKQIKRADILLELDNYYYIRCWLSPQDIVASCCGVSTTTVYNVSKQYVEEGLAATIMRKKRVKPPVAPIASSDTEAKIIALATSAPPQGCNRWTLRMLEKETVKAGIVDSISDTTIGRILKKHQIQLNQ